MQLYYIFRGLIVHALSGCLNTDLFNVMFSQTFSYTKKLHHEKLYPIDLETIYIQFV